MLWSSAHPSRRALLSAGAFGGAAALSGCGLRVGQPSRRRSALAEESTRSRLAAVLHTTAPPRIHPEHLSRLQQAIGPAHESPAAGQKRSFGAAMAQTVDLVLKDIPTLGGPQTAVLVDIAVAASSLAAPLSARAYAQRFAALPTLGYPVWADADAPAPPPPKDPDPLTEFALAAFQASYGYGQAALAFGGGTPVRTQTEERMEQLAQAGADANALLKHIGRPEAANRPAWRLPTVPRTPDTAHDLARRLEDLVTAKLFRVFEDRRCAVFAARELKASADARAAAGGRELLRYRGAPA